MILDELDRVLLGRPGYGDCPRVREKAVERIVAFAQPSLDVIDGVDQARVHLDLAASDHLHTLGFAHTRLVVAIDIGAHGELGLVG